MKSNFSRFYGMLIIFALAVFGNEALAQEEQAPDQTVSPAAAAPSEDQSIGLNVDVEMASAYLFRGQNLFMNRNSDARELNQHSRLSPSITWSIFNTGLSVGYWGAYQLIGNVKENIELGYGAEQDLIVGYTHSFGENLKLNAGLTYYFYPFADEDKAGTSFPSWLDFGVGATYSWLLDLSLNIRYYTGVQEALRSYNYTYFNPMIGKGFNLIKNRMDLALALGFGYKLFNDREIPENKNNVYDILFTAAAPIKFKERFYVKPNLGVTWTNLEGDEKTFSDKFSIYFAASVGADF